MTLEGLDQEVADVCGLVRTFTGEDTLMAAELLSGLVERLESLTRALHTQQAAVKKEIDAVAVRRRALHAYSGGGGPRMTRTARPSRTNENS